MIFDLLLRAFNFRLSPRRRTHSPLATPAAVDLLELRTLPSCITPGGYFNPKADNPLTDDNLVIHDSGSGALTGQLSVATIGRFDVTLNCDPRTGIVTLTPQSNDVSGSVTLLPDAPGLYHAFFSLQTTTGLRDLHQADLIHLS